MDRLKRYGPTLNCVVTLTEERGRRQARKADKEIAAGRYRWPCHGIPWGVKDLSATKGYPTSWETGSSRAESLMKTPPSSRVSMRPVRFLLPKLTTGELALDDIWFGGQTKNQNRWDLTMSSQRSSAGPGAATAAGLVSFSVGTEMLGSIVEPSGGIATETSEPLHQAVALNANADASIVGEPVKWRCNCTISQRLTPFENENGDAPKAPIRTLVCQGDVNEMMWERLIATVLMSFITTIGGKCESSAPVAPVSTTRKGDGSPAVSASLTSTGGRTLTRALGLKVGTVVIDPGHGGRDSGCISPSGLQEKEVALDVARRLGALIEQRLGAELIYTRSDDSYMGLQDRTRIANEIGADLFLSIHVNSSAKPDVSGVESYYLNFTATPAGLDVAAQENAGSGNTIHDLSVLIQKISGHEKTAESKEFATTVQGGLLNVRTSRSVTNRGVRPAPFVVLIGAKMPAVLVELGFLSNSRDEGLLQTSEHRERLAKGLYQGLSDYVERLGQFRGVAPVFVRSQLPVSEPAPLNPWPAAQTPEQSNRTLLVSVFPIREIGIGICVLISGYCLFDYSAVSGIDNRARTKLVYRCCY